MAFPKIIHQIWIQGEAALPEKFKKNMDITIKKNPEYKYMLWDEIKILELIQLKPEWVKKYYKFEYLHQKVDYAKLIILYMYGGIAIDMDAYTEQNLDKLFETYADYDLVVSLFQTETSEYQFLLVTLIFRKKRILNQIKERR